MWPISTAMTGKKKKDCIRLCGGIEGFVGEFGHEGSLTGWDGVAGCCCFGGGEGKKKKWVFLCSVQK